MKYNFYKNLSNQEFDKLKEQLSNLDREILELRGNELIKKNRVDEKDYLILNYYFANEKYFLSNLSILYKDYPGTASFDIGIIKAFDESHTRYSKMELVGKGVALENLKINIGEYLKACIDKYYSWSEADVKNSEVDIIGE